jgi:hypothetical protein
LATKKSIKINYRICREEYVNPYDFEEELTPGQAATKI